jgi:endo-1,4-beta-xylanase
MYEVLMTLITRRDVLKAGVASMAAASITTSKSFAQSHDTKDSLASIAAKSGIIYGASAARELFMDESYRRLYARETKSITTDYALKFDALRPNETDYQFEGADALIQFATENKLQKRGHTLVWNENAPAWLLKKSSVQTLKIMDEHIDKVAARYKGKIDVWDVVNEPFWPGHNAKGGFRKGVWYDKLGTDYIARALIRTAKIDPNAQLAINEAHTERSDELGMAIRAGIIRLIDDLQHKGVPLHAIGLQGHLQPQFASNDKGFVEFLQQIEARKLDIHITELDIDDSSYVGSVSERDKQSALRIYDFLSHVLSVKNVKMIISWQLSDRYSWYSDLTIMKQSGAQRAPRPLPFDADMERKPIWHAMKRAFEERAKS